MTITVEWGKGSTPVVVWTFLEGWQWEDLFEAQMQSNPMIGTVDHPVDIIADFSASPRLPQQAFSNYKEAFDRRPANRGRIIFVGQINYLKAMASTFQRIYRTEDPRFEFAASLEQAYAMLVRTD